MTEEEATIGSGRGRASSSGYLALQRALRWHTAMPADLHISLSVAPSCLCGRAEGLEQRRVL